MPCWSQCPKIIRYYKKHPQHVDTKNQKSAEDLCDESCSSNPTSITELDASITKSKVAHREKLNLKGRKLCASKCSIDVVTDQLLSEIEEKQKEVDEYILNKGFNYFYDICTCSFTCLVYNLWRDDFVKTTLVSAVLFTIGLKLCFELDGLNIMDDN